MRKVIIILILALFIVFPIFQALASNDTNYRFTGQEYEPMIDMYNFNQRDYTPNTGKFIQPDPVLKNLHDPQTLKQKTGQNLEQILSDPQNLNEYSYTKNNPVVYTDPEGEWFKEVFSGQQSVSDFQLEVGGVANYQYDNSSFWKKVYDHPVISGALTGVTGGLLSLAGSALLAGEGVLTFSLTNIFGNKADKLVGTNFGKLGTVIERGSGKITGFLRENGSLHGLHQIINRNVKPEILLDTVKNPLLRLKQSGDNILYLSKQAAVVLNKVGEVVTSYTNKEFKEPIKQILKLIKK